MSSPPRTCAAGWRRRRLRAGRTSAVRGRAALRKSDAQQSGGRAMADDPRVQQLLDEVFDSGRTPEEVCCSFPELLPQVRARWREMCRAEAELNALFPTMT